MNRGRVGASGGPELFEIPDDFRAFMRDIVARLDFGDDPASVVGDVRSKPSAGAAGASRARDLFRFQYIANGGHDRWEIELRQQQMRDIAGGLIDEVEASGSPRATRASRAASALLVWGEYDEDALRIRSLGDLGVALDAMQLDRHVEPCCSGCGRPATIRSSRCQRPRLRALHRRLAARLRHLGRRSDAPRHVRVRSTTTSARSSIPWADCIPWRVARPALLRFAEHGELGEQVILDGSDPEQFLMLGDYDRAAELATRRTPRARSGAVEPAAQGAVRRVGRAAARRASSTCT